MEQIQLDCDYSRSCICSELTALDQSTLKSSKPSQYYIICHVLTCLAVIGTMFKSFIKLWLHQNSNESISNTTIWEILSIPISCHRKHTQLTYFQTTCPASSQPYRQHSGHKRFWLDLHLQTLFSVLSAAAL